MIKSLRFLACAALLAGSAAANATSYAFQYTMLDQTVITGSFNGTASGNLVTDISKLAIAINGVFMPNSGNLYAYGIVNSVLVDDAVVSFDGLRTSLVGASNSFLSGDPGSLFVLAPLGGTGNTDSISYNVVGIPNNGEGDGDYSASRWHLAAVTAVPEPATYAMLLGGLALLGTVARRRKAQ